LDIISRHWANPDIVYEVTFTDGYGVYPSQYVFPAFSLPEFNVLLIYGYLKSIIEIQAAVPTLLTFKAFWRHVSSPALSRR
jgi:hypothetical protein